MALAALPYKYSITSRSVISGHTDVTVVYNIIDGSNNILVTGATINISPTISPQDFFDQLRTAVLNQMLVDAGSPANFLTAITGKSISITQ